MTKRGKTSKQGDLLIGFAPEKIGVTVRDVCKVFHGKEITEKELIEQLKFEESLKCGVGGEWLVKRVKSEGVYWWVLPRKQ
jgi:hypothetical protein